MVHLLTCHYHHTHAPGQTLWFTFLPVIIITHMPLAKPCGSPSYLSLSSHTCPWPNFVVHLLTCDYHHTHAQTFLHFSDHLVCLRRMPTAEPSCGSPFHLYLLHTCPRPNLLVVQILTGTYHNADGQTFVQFSDHFTCLRQCRGPNSTAVHLLTCLYHMPMVNMSTVQRLTCLSSHSDGQYVYSSLSHLSS